MNRWWTPPWSWPHCWSVRAVAFVIGVGGQRADVPFPEMSAAFAAVVAAALAWPTALWLRRAFLARRYGAALWPRRTWRPWLRT